MVPAATKRRSTRQASTRKRSLYAEPDTEDDFEADTSDGEAEYDPEPALPQPKPKKRKVAATTNTRRRTTRSKVSNVKKAPGKRKTQTKIIGHARKPRSTAVEKAEAGKFRGPSDGKIPDWTSLPLAILQDIFIFASQPLDGDKVSWLYKASHTCRAFAEPALDAYYHTPLIQHTLHPHHLLELVKIQEGRLFKYNAKVRRLEIDMRKLSYTAHNRPLFDLSRLVERLPQLQHLEITNPIDMPPYRRMNNNQQWYYPPDFFAALNPQRHVEGVGDTSGVRLKSWRWSRDMMDTSTTFEDMFPSMAVIHESPAFQTIEELTICGYDVYDSPATIINPDSEQEQILDLPFALSKLSALKSLTFISCDIVRDDFLAKLPSNLQSLTLTNCWKLTNDTLSAYLHTHAAHLTTLSLNHNVTLNLAFLPHLATSAPKLQHLSMDGHYYSERVSINDAEPEYTSLLSPDSIPTWPPTLQSLSLIHLQKWSAPAATNFFSSLATSAPELPSLRILRVQAHINIPWRDRAGFRDEWIDRLQAIYLRRPAPPNPCHGSKKQFAQYHHIQQDGAGEDELAALMHPRPLSHVAPSPHKASGETDAFLSSSEDELAQHKPATRRSTRVAQSLASRESEREVIGEAEESDLQSEEDADAPPPFVQGLCDVVDVRIDNQRPRENLFTEQDFLDSEASGDEDWDEGAEEAEEGGYAW